MRLGILLALLLSTGCRVDADGDGVSEDSDCDDNNSLVSPNASEICDGLDNDCDNEIDENVTSVFYLDSDGDGYGLETPTIEDCEAPSGYTGVLGDCNDTEASINPGADELCDYIDNDCDDKIDENITAIFYYDGDGDGVGTADSATEGCLDEPPTDPSYEGVYVTVSGDCDDSNPSVNPYAVEICDGIDNDCEGDIDDDYAEDAATWYVDSDGDGYGVDDEITNVTACSQPGGYVSNTDDCDDTEATTSPAGEEVCDSVDNNCDGEIDEATATDATTWYGDADGDGYGGSTFSIVACDQPDSYVSGDPTDASSIDCDDLNAEINPSATEICDELDNDCNTLIDDNDNNIVYLDESGQDVIWYIDADSDSYGSDNFTLQQCDQPSGYVDSDTNSIDCNDLDAEINPGEDEVCDDGKDNNCDDSPSPCSLEGDISVDDSDYVISGSDGAPSGSAEQGDQVGWSLAVGDFNGDDEADLLIGASGLNGDNTDDGGAYILFGPLSDPDMAAATDATGVLTGNADADNVGYAVTAADVDGDGYDDFLITSYGEDVISDDTGVEELDGAGRVYLIYGSSDVDDVLAGTLDLESASAAWFSGAVDSEHFGCALSSGDINGDNQDDIIIGSCVDSSPGTTYLIYGSSTRFLGEITPYDEIIAETDGYALWEGATDNSYAGQSVSGLGDLDGDGIDDFALGAYGHDVEISSNTTYADAGAAFVILGDATEHTGELEVESAGAYFNGENPYDNAGIAVVGVGDTNGDGYDDFVVGASGYDLDLTSNTNGAAYLVLGSANVNGAQSHTAKIVGENQYDQFGDGLGMVGDIDDDGYTDLSIGAYTADGNYGAVYLFYGPVSGDIDAADSDAKFSGSDAGEGEFGRGIAGPGDLDGDGEMDLIVGAGADDGDGSSNSTDIGAVYIFTGGGL